MSDLRREYEYLERQRHLYGRELAMGKIHPRTYAILHKETTEKMDYIMNEIMYVGKAPETGEIYLKYAPGSKVFILSSGEVREVVVISVEVTHSSEDGLTSLYSLGETPDIFLCKLTEDEIFASKQDLLNSL